MSNVKISQLPEFTGDPAGIYLVMNNANETTTYKVLRESVLGSSGTAGSSGSSGTSGQAGSSGTSGISGLGLPAKNIFVDKTGFSYGGTYSVKTITFATPFSSTSYSIDFQWTLDNIEFYDLSQTGNIPILITGKTASGFTISIGTDITANNDFNGYIQAIATGSSNGSGLDGSSGTSGTSGSGDRNGLITTGSIAGTQSITGSLISSGSLKIFGSTILTGSVNETPTPLTIASNTASLVLSSGSYYTLQLVPSTDTHILPSVIKAGQSLSIFINTTGSATVSFPTSVKQVSGSAYVPTTTTGIDIITLISKDTSNLYLVKAQNFI